MKEKLDIINSFGLQVEPLEDPLAYRVINNTDPVNIDDLLIALKKATVFYSEDYKREQNGDIISTIASVECIILDYGNIELNIKYKIKFFNAYQTDYLEGKVLTDTIDTFIDGEMRVG